MQSTGTVPRASRERDLAYDVRQYHPMRPCHDLEWKQITLIYYRFIFSSACKQGFKPEAPHARMDMDGEFNARTV